jgi:hypothetical protein
LAQKSPLKMRMQFFLKALIIPEVLRKAMKLSCCLFNWTQ